MRVVTSAHCLMFIGRHALVNGHLVTGCSGACTVEIVTLLVMYQAYSVMSFPNDWLVSWGVVLTSCMQCAPIV